MKYSVIIPFWNAEPWLSRCLKSLVNQRGDFEFIFVDDHSTDNGKNILLECEDKRVKVIDNHRAKGVSGARNSGIDIATGDYITFLDADDEYIDGAYGMFEQITQEGANIFQLNHWRHYKQINKRVMKYDNPMGVYNTEKMPECWYGVWNKLFKREFLNNIRFNEELKYGEDGLFVLECLAKDNQIYHAQHSFAVVIHNFDNKESLSHLKSAELVLKQIHEYEKFMLEQDNPRIRTRVCLELATLWSAPRVLKLIGNMA